MVNVAILGFGVVGSGTAEVLTENLTLIEARIHKKLNIKYILDLRDFPDSPFADRVIHDFNIILEDPEVTLVAEMMGGSHPAYDFSIACLRAGKSVVTSNKEVVANFGDELLAVAKENNVRYMFEASVGGGIPIIRPLANDLAANQVLSIDGILNGTTNYILTQMGTTGAAFSDALKEAQAKGYAEANPSADIDGIDAARKITILAALSYGVLLDPNKIYTEGITKITTSDMKIASELGYAIKLIGHCEKIGDKVLAMVSPRLIPASNPLHTIDDVFNGILVDTDMLGATMFYGRGAGKLPTASAVVGDIIDIAKSPENDPAFPMFTKACDCKIADIADYRCRNMLVLEGNLKENGAEIDSLPVKALEVFVDNGRTAIITEEITEKQCSDLCTSLGDKLLSRIRVL